MTERLALSAILRFRAGTTGHYARPHLSSRFYEAFAFVGNLTRNDIRVTGVPYISHLMNVAGIVLENGGSEDEAIAALLHDVLEDHGRSSC